MSTTGEFAFSVKSRKDDSIVLPIIAFPTLSSTTTTQAERNSSNQSLEVSQGKALSISNLDQYSCQYMMKYFSLSSGEWDDITINFDKALQYLETTYKTETANYPSVFNVMKAHSNIYESQFDPGRDLVSRKTTMRETRVDSTNSLPPIRRNSSRLHDTTQSLFEENTVHTFRTADLDASNTLKVSRSMPNKKQATLGKFPSKTRAKVAAVRTSNPPELSQTDALRNELVKSLGSMQRHTTEVKQSILNVQELVALKNPRARAFITAMAADQLCSIITVIGRRELRRGWSSWTLSVKIYRLTNQIVNVRNFIYLREVAIRLDHLVQTVLRYNFLEWVKFCVAERLRVEMEMKTAAAITIQRVVRGNIGRERARKAAEGNKFAKLHRSLIKLQAVFRGKLQRWKYLKYRRDILEETSCELIQKVVRGFLGRRKAHRIRSYQSKVSAAITIQSAARGRKGRIVAAAIRLLRLKNKVVVRIQSLARGYIGRLKVAAILREKVQNAAAIKIQARIRGVVTRMNLHHRRRELEEYRSERKRYATKIQATYRGFRARVMFRYYMEEHIQEVQMKNMSATKIQCLIRTFLARRRVARLQQDRLDRWIVDALSWKEIWSEDTGAWFYLNESTEEALWEPPPVGYTKSDGQLVLKNGKIIDPPDLSGKKKRAPGQEHLCIECVKRVAIRKCLECGDNFCTKCYKETHSTGSRKQHTYEPIGPLDCTECEEELAERWCISCDEPYCDSCWRKVHSKGKRRYHPFSQVREDGHIENRIFTIDGEQVHNYDASYAQNRFDEEKQAATAESQWADGDFSNYESQTNDGSAYSLEMDSPWNEYYDENNIVYWYNSTTGESTYDDPSIF